MSWRVYCTGLALLLVAGAFLLTDVLLWQPGVTATNVQRIRRGMTVAEVEALLGAPARRGPGVSWLPQGLPAGEPLFGPEWTGPGLTVRVWFDRSGQALLVERWPVRPR